MKYANLIHASGVLVIAIYALMIIFPFEHVNMNALLALGFLLGYIGQSMRLHHLKSQIESK